MRVMVFGQIELKLLGDAQILVTTYQTFQTAEMGRLRCLLSFYKARLDCVSSVFLQSPDKPTTPDRWPHPFDSI